MPKFRNLLCFLSHVFLVYITSVSSDSGGPNDLVFNVTSCDVSGTIHATKDSHVASFLVECDHNDGDTLKATDISDHDVTITGCPINKQVKIFVFDTAHAETEGPVVKSSGLLKEIIVVCNGVNIKVESHFTNSPLTPMTVTSIPLTNELTIKVTERGSTTPVINVDIEHRYQLKISSPVSDNMHILVESCDAASNSEFTEHLVELYTDREPNPAYGVLEKFKDDPTSGMVSVMKGFRLLDSSAVYLRCFVDVCAQADCPSLTTTISPTATLSPTTTTAAAHRRRRNVDIPNRKVTLSTSFRVKSSFTTSRANGYSAGDGRCVVLASLLLAKTFFDRY